MAKKTTVINVTSTDVTYTAFSNGEIISDTLHSDRKFSDANKALAAIRKELESEVFKVISVEKLERVKTKYELPLEVVFKQGKVLGSAVVTGDDVE